MRAKRHYSVRETYRITHDAARTARSFIRLRAQRGEQYAERIMLAVTEVNGCALCAYGHTRFALRSGMDAGEIRDLLGGVTEVVPDDELPAVAFAQHYADTGGHPDRDAWARLVEIYGEEQALGVLGTSRVMMCGNAVGIPWSSLLTRLRGSPHPDSTLRYEIGTIVGASLTMPFALGHAAVSTLLGQPAISFTDDR